MSITCSKAKKKKKCPHKKRTPSHKNQAELVLVTPDIETELEATKQHVLFLSKKAKLN